MEVTSALLQAPVPQSIPGQQREDLGRISRLSDHRSRGVRSQLEGFTGMNEASNTNKVQHDKVRKNTFDVHSFAMQLSSLIATSMLFSRVWVSSVKKNPNQQAQSRGRTAALSSTGPERHTDSPSGSTHPDRTSPSGAP